MFITILLAKIKSVILFILSRFRRALCCFRRRRRPSCDVEPLTYVGVVSNQSTTDVENWTEWTENNTYDLNQKPSTIQEHIESYRQHQALLAAKCDEKEVDENFFEDMTPRITKQTKVFINSNQGEHFKKSGLSLAPDGININGELEEWVENSGWEGQTTDWDLQEALKETKRIERERRLWEQQQRRMERSARPIALGAKLNS